MSSLRLHWQYQYELHQLLRQRLRSILLLIMGLLLLFSLFDYLLFAERFSALLPVRLLALTGGLLLLLINHLDRRGRYALPVGLFSYLCACGVTLFILQQTDHSNTSYYFGLIMVMIIYATLTPLTAGQTLGIGCLLSFAYFVSLRLVDHASGNTHHWEHINNLFFMFSFVLVTTLYNWTEPKPESMNPGFAVAITLPPENSSTKPDSSSRKHYVVAGNSRKPIDATRCSTNPLPMLWY
jgi:hypothetical protein